MIVKYEVTLLFSVNFGVGVQMDVDLGERRRIQENNFRLGTIVYTRGVQKYSRNRDLNRKRGCGR